MTREDFQVPNLWRTARPWTELAAWLGMAVLGFVGGDYFGPRLAIVVLVVAFACRVQPFRRETPIEPAPGQWLTGPGARRRLWVERLILPTCAALAGLIGGRAWMADDPRVALLGAVLALIYLVLTPAPWLRPISIPELRIDETGVFSGRLERCIAWDEIAAIEPRRPADRGALRLRLTTGEEVLLPLSAIGVPRERIVNEITRRRPDLIVDVPLAASEANGIVQPILMRDKPA